MSRRKADGRRGGAWFLPSPRGGRVFGPTLPDFGPYARGPAAGTMERSHPGAAMRPMRRVHVLIPILAVLTAASCGDDTFDAGTTSTTAEATSTEAATTGEAATTTTTTAITTTTTTTSTTTTTTMPTTTTTEAEEEAWVNGDIVLTAGDCFVEVEVDDGKRAEEAPCDGPHLAEVIGTGQTVCPTGMDADAFSALLGDYVGVPADEALDWLDQHGLTARQSTRFDEGRLAGTMCTIVAEAGEITGSYRAG